MSFARFIVEATPVALIGVVMYFLAQRWLCDVKTERGVHWRGMILKLAAWPVFLVGTVFAVLHAEIPYIPTPKEAVRGRFLRLAWPQLMLTALYAITLVRVLYIRAHVADGSLELSAEAVWGMMAFATLPVVAALGALYAAWQARQRPTSAPWDQIDVAQIGGPS
jgi:cellulose synthase (UDP-forming)